MRVSITTAFLLLAAASAAVANECGVCADKVTESDKRVYDLVFHDGYMNTTLCGYEEHGDKKQKDEGFCSYNATGAKIENKDDLKECPPKIKMEECKGRN
ncbi:hypothetical protein C8R44DRAFT_872095 [Mycena epipterygia]|nr:hypothetical protein C8R44DRAFT_872095 [Mycena epipterygia]